MKKWILKSSHVEKSIYQHGKLLCFLSLQEVQQVTFHQLPKLDSLNGPSKVKELVSLNEMNAPAPESTCHRLQGCKSTKILTGILSFLPCTKCLLASSLMSSTFSLGIC